MFVVSRAPGEPSAINVPDGLTYGVPCAFRGCSGFYHPAGGRTGVVLCSPWGYEELTSRKGWRLLAEAIAKAGFPCMRFDYPGTGNSLGRSTSVTSVADWIAAINDAATFLRLHSGVRQFVFIGQSLGATLAVEAARNRTDVAGLQLIAPVARGRPYVRELAATATIVAEKVGIKLEYAPDEGLSVLGFALSPAMVESLKSLDLADVTKLDVQNITVFDQADRKAGAEAAEYLRRSGAAVSFEEIEPYHLMVSDATVMQPLPVTSERVVESLRRLDPAVPARSTKFAGDASAILVGDVFREETVRFGAQQALFGVLCRPNRQRPGAPAVIMLNRGLNPHVGWRRASVDQARSLAGAGITCLRFDVAGIGESRDEPSRPANLIYSDLLLADISAAVDQLVARGHQRIMLAGVCSGGYMALTAAHADPRITDIVVVNTQRIMWDPREDVEEVIRYGLRSVNDYVGDIKGRGALKKLIRSRHRVVPAMRFLMARGIKTFMSNVPIGLRSTLLRGSMAARVNAFFTVLAEHGTRVSLVYSEEDPGLVELRNYFGPRGRDLRFPNVSLSFLADADHNLTSTRASDWMLDHIVGFADGVPPRETTRTRHFAMPQEAVCHG